VKKSRRRRQASARGRPPAPGLQGPLLQAPFEDGKASRGGIAAKPRRKFTAGGKRAGRTGRRKDQRSRRSASGRQALGWTTKSKKLVRGHPTSIKAQDGASFLGVGALLLARAGILSAA